MSVYYLCRTESEVEGPFTVGQLRRMWRAGEITCLAQICDAKSDHWFDISVIEDQLEPPPPRHVHVSRPFVPPATARRKSSFSVVRVLGALVLIGGAFFLLGGLGLDTTVEGETGRIHNIGRMNDRTSLLICGGFTSLGGLLMILLGGRKS